MIPLTIWMNMPSFYQVDLFRSLVATGEVDLQVVFAGELPIERWQLGWAEDLSGFSATFLSGEKAKSKNSHATAIQRAIYHRHRLNIVNGIWAEPTFVLAVLSWMATGGRFALYSEAQQPNLPRHPAKKAAQRVFGRAVARRTVGVFPISHFAANFYRHLGVSEEKLYPFGYFRAHPVVPPSVPMSSRQVEIIYVGQFIQRKGLDILLLAMDPLLAMYSQLSLTLVGQGVEQEWLRKTVEQRGWAARVQIEPSLPFDQIPQRIGRASLLVLPSYWDGWGLVVNEALGVGVPAVVSDQCGAADLIQDGVNGYRFSAGNVVELRSKLAHFLANPNLHEQMRQKAAQTGRQISAAKAADYLVDCCRHILGLSSVHPLPMWERHP